mmetsp:Transcript_6446/g.19048  ORF Transcript_6446/g.19048 Transcript_6446/m.19048 type:complete len:1038 (+) Transcript_6446:88-3201(+)
MAKSSSSSGASAHVTATTKKATVVTKRGSPTPKPKSAAKAVPTKSVSCAHSNKRILIGRATLQDLKNKSTYNNNQKRLWTIPSTAIRNKVYSRAAVAIAEWEQSLLPPYGQRIWDVSVSVTETAPNALFRAWKGEMELATLPHFLERIPTPPRWPGQLARRNEQWEENYRNVDADGNHTHKRGVDLLAIETSDLSSCAWNQLRPKHAVPVFTVRWKAPDYCSFSSRKSAWEYAEKLCEKEVQINKLLYGIGSTGKLLQPNVPSAQTRLKIGRLRFERDGLWVVGQGLNWQDHRHEQLAEEMQQRQRQQALQRAAHIEELKRQRKEAEAALAKQRETPQVRKRKHSALLMYIDHNRHQEQQSSDKNITLRDAEIILRKKWKKLKESEQLPWKEKAAEANGETLPPAKSPKKEPKLVIPDHLKKWTPLSFFIRTRRHEYRLERMQDAPGGKRGFTLADAESELRALWKSLEVDEHQVWAVKMQHAIEEISLAAMRARQQGPSSQVQDLEKGHLKPEDFRKSSKNEPVDANAQANDANDANVSVELTPPLCVDVTKSEKEQTKDDKVMIDATPQTTTAAGTAAASTTITTTTAVTVDGATESSDQSRPASEALTSPTPSSSSSYSSTTSTASVEHDRSCLVEDLVDLRSATICDSKPSAGEKKTAAKTKLDTRPASSDTNTNQLDGHTTESSVAPEVPCNKATTKSEPTVTDETVTDTSNESGHNSNEENVECSSSTTAATNATTLMTDIPPPEESKTKKASKSWRKKAVTFKDRRRWCLDDLQIRLCYDAIMDHYESVMRTVKTRDLARELQDGFDVLRERGRGRYDMELPVFEKGMFDFLNCVDSTPWMPVVRAILGDDAILIHKGSFMSLPGASTQEYHQDGVHLSSQSQKPCHAVNVFIPVVDLTARNGPTEFVLGSHILGQDDFDRDFVETPKVTAGTPIIFDYRLGHRGLSNSSQACRPIVYCTYARAAQGKEFRDSVNFSRRRYHPIGELVDRPLSREERRRNRSKSMKDREDEDLKQALELSKQQQHRGDND